MTSFLDVLLPKHHLLPIFFQPVLRLLQKMSDQQSPLLPRQLLPLLELANLAVGLGESLSDVHGSHDLLELVGRIAHILLLVELEGEAAKERVIE